MYDAPKYQEWFLKAPHAQAYKEHKAQLQILQWHYPNDRWLLKSPGHMFGLPELLKTYPDALIIQTHRDLSKVLPSVASLGACVRGMNLTRIDHHHLGGQILEQMEIGMKIMSETIPKLPKRQYISIDYNDIVEDPMKVVTNIYEHFDIELTEKAKSAMAREIARNPKDKKGAHHYSMEQFGFTKEGLNERLGKYLDA